MKRIFNKSALLIFLNVTVTLYLPSCSSTESDDESLESSEEGAENEESDTAEGGNEQGTENTAEEGNNSNSGEDVNNATENEFNNQAAAPTEQTAEQPIENAPIENQASSDTSANTQSAIESTPVDTVAPAATELNTPSSGGVVRYITADVSGRNQPNQSASSVAQYEKGDHPLVWEEGEWVKTDRGVYVPKTAISQKAVGRNKNSKGWK